MASHQSASLATDRSKPESSLFFMEFSPQLSLAFPLARFLLRRLVRSDESSHPLPLSLCLIRRVL